MTMLNQLEKLSVKAAKKVEPSFSFILMLLEMIHT